MRNKLRIREIRDDNGGNGGLTMGPRDLRQQLRRRRRKMIPNTSTTTTEASSEDRRRVQGIIDNDGGVNGSITGLIDYQRQRSVGFPCYRVANSNTVSYLSRRCLVLILFSSDSFCFLGCKKVCQY